jgi:hypothetical protein
MRRVILAASDEARPANSLRIGCRHFSVDVWPVGWKCAYSILALTFRSSMRIAASSRD